MEGASPNDEPRNSASTCTCNHAAQAKGFNRSSLTQGVRVVTNYLGQAPNPQTRHQSS